MGRIKFATWNVGGCILGKSNQADGKPNVNHYIEAIAANDPDIICLQEALQYLPLGNKNGQSDEIASALNYPYVATCPISLSHLQVDKPSCLSLAVISKFPILAHSCKEFPNPNLRIKYNEEEWWQTHDKGFMICEIDSPCGILMVMNAHLFPLHHFSTDILDFRVEPVWKVLNQKLIKLAGKGGFLAGIDLNTPDYQTVLKPSLQFMVASNANMISTPKNIQQDYLLCSHDFACDEVVHINAGSDHYLCMMTIEKE